MFSASGRLAQVRSSGLVVGIVFLAATTFIACARGGSDLEERVKLLETSRNEMAAQLRIATVELDSLNKGQLIPILDFIDRADLHNMNDNLQKATRINRLYVGTVIKVRRVVVATSWPAPLKGEAEAFKVTLAELERTLTKADLTESRKTVYEAHSSYHALVDKGWKLVAGEPNG